MRKIKLEGIPLPTASRRAFLGGVALSALAVSDAGALEPAVDLRRKQVRIPGVRATKTTGSISGGSNELAVASSAGFAVGDSIIVELGGEASRGRPGSPGVGGVWPALKYGAETAMKADTMQASDTYCYCADTGLVYQWAVIDGARTWFNDPSEYYWRYALPLALTAKIIGISGTNLTLNARAAVSSAHATVHFDNAPVFNAAARVAADHTALKWPAGEFACGRMLELANRQGMMIAGAGQGRTTLFSPKGVMSVGMTISASPRTEVSHLTLAGNAYLTSGWGLDLRSNGQRARPQWNLALDFVRSDYSTAHDIRFTYAWQAASAHNCDRCNFKRLSATTDGLQRYIAWTFNWVNSTNCWSYDCEVKSTYITKAFECFASNYCGHIRPHAVNGVFALNSTGHCIIDSPTVVLTPQSVLSHLSIPFPGTSIVDVTTNINQNRGQSDNSILNMKFVQQGYLTPQNDVMIGVNVAGDVRNTMIKGGTYSAPDYIPPSSQYGAQAVNSNDGVMNTIVDGIVVKGKARGTGGSSNIAVMRGSVTNCVAETIGCTAPKCAASGNRRGPLGRAGADKLLGYPNLL